MKRGQKIGILSLLWILLGAIWLCSMIELTTLVSYHYFFTAGELFAWVTANGYETGDITQYCLRYVWPYWALCSLICAIGAWLIWRCVQSENGKRIYLCAAIEAILLIPFVVLPLPCNIVRESIYVRQQIRNIRIHYNDAQTFKFNAYRKTPMGHPEVYVMAIGESVRYANWSLNSFYPRRTAPHMEQQSNLCLYSDYYANATLTQHALPTLFSPATADNFNDHFKYKNIASAFSETGFRTALVSQRAQLMNNGYHNYLAQDFDTIVWVEQDSLIAVAVTNLAQKEEKIFIITHYLGNHMFYTNRAEDCLVWRPDYNVDPKAHSDSLFLNAYDNSLLYTDRLLGECVDALNQIDKTCAWLFVSDHGEYISPRVSGHGHTYHPTKDEYHVPLMIWVSDEYADTYPEKVANMIHHKDEPVCADHVFWSVLDMADIHIDSTLQQEGMSIFGYTLLPHQRALLLPDGKSVMDLD